MDAWRARLDRGDLDGAWVAFEQAYRRLVLSVIRRLVSEADEIEEAWSVVRSGLGADGLARLRRYRDSHPSGAAVASWLVVVVRRLVIDWLRREQGRARDTVPSDLTGWRRAAYVARCIERLGVAETFEVTRGQGDGDLAFTAFLRDLRALARSHPCPPNRPSRDVVPLASIMTLTTPVADPGEALELSRRLQRLLAEEPDDLRLAIQLFVIDDVPAAEVARVVGWPDAKAVYNRVSRALRRMRESLSREGIGRDDL